MRTLIFIVSIFILSFHATRLGAQEPSLPDVAGQTCSTLSSCYRWALERSETIAIQNELIEEAQGRFLQALGNILPEISYEYSHERQETSGAPSSVRRDTPEGKFTFTQTLFSGFKEFAAIMAGRSQARQREYELQRARQLLFRDVSDAFYFYLSYQQDLETLESVRGILNDRLEELKKREALGRSRPSELASVDAKTRRLEAEMEGVRSQQEVARQLLEFLTGVPIMALQDDALLDQNLGSLETYLTDVHVNQRPDVLASQELWQQAQKQVTIASAGYWPEVTLDGNQYTKRVGTSENVDWDATLSVEVPVFQVAETRGAVRQAQAQRNQAELKYQQSKRRAALEIQNSYSQLQGALRRYEALSKALEATQKNYELQLQDFQVNLVNHLDVLQALEELEDSRRDHISIQNEMKQIYWQFHVAIGDLPDVTF